jgi:cyclohexanecarboxyl-CoA dehydrogenase
VIHEEIARADLSLSYINLLASLNGQILAAHGQPEVVGALAGEAHPGEALLAIALTEPRGGSDAANLRLRIERDGDDYVINGEKTSISAADQADICGGLRPHRHGRVRAHGVTALLVPMRRARRHPSRFDCHGQRAIGRGSLFFENVRVPGPPAGRREQGLCAGDAGLRLLARPDRPAGAGRGTRGAGGDLGVRPPARGLRPAAVGLPGRVAPAGRLRHPGHGARLLCLQALWLKDQQLPHSAEAAMCKWWAPSWPTTPSTSAC